MPGGFILLSTFRLRRLPPLRISRIMVSADEGGIDQKSETVFSSVSFVPLGESPLEVGISQLDTLRTCERMISCDVIMHKWPKMPEQLQCKAFILSQCVHMPTHVAHLYG